MNYLIFSERNMLKQLSLVFFIGFVSCTSIEKAKEVQEKEDLGYVKLWLDFIVYFGYLNHFGTK